MLLRLAFSCMRLSSSANFSSRAAAFDSALALSSAIYCFVLLLLLVIFILKKVNKIR